MNATVMTQDEAARAEAPEDKRKTVIVNCSQPNGLIIQLYTLHPSDGTMHHKVPDANFGQVTLGGGANEVDAEFMDRWLEENQNNDLLKNGIISVAKKDDDADSRDRVESEGEDTDGSGRGTSET